MKRHYEEGGSIVGKVIGGIVVVAIVFVFWLDNTWQNDTYGAYSNMYGKKMTLSSKNSDRSFLADQVTVKTISGIKTFTFTHKVVGEVDMKILKGIGDENVYMSKQAR